MKARGIVKKAREALTAARTPAQAADSQAADTESQQAAQAADSQAADTDSQQAAPSPVKGFPMLGVRPTRDVFRLSVNASEAQRKLDEAMSQVGRAGRLLMTRSGRMIIRDEQLDMFSRYHAQAGHGLYRHRLAPEAA